MSIPAGINFTVNVTEGESVPRSKANIAEVENANRAMISNVRQGVQIGLFAIVALGIAVDQTLQLLVESVFLSIEVILAIQAAALPGGAALGIGTFLKGATVVSMLALAWQIKIQKQKNTRKSAAIVGGLRLASFR